MTIDKIELSNDDNFISAKFSLNYKINILHKQSFTNDLRAIIGINYHLMKIKLEK